MSGKSFKELLLDFSKHLTTKDISNIKNLHSDEVGNGTFETAMDPFSVLRLLNEHGIIEDEESLKKLMEEIGKRNPLVKECKFELEYTCGPVCMLSTKVKLSKKFIKEFKYIINSPIESSKWSHIKEDEYQIMQSSNETYVKIQDLLVKTGYIYSVNMLINNQIGDELQISCDGIKAINEAVCGIVNIDKNNVIKFSHNDGIPDNVHLSECNLIITDTTDCKPIQKGASICVKTVAEFRSLAKGYQDQSGGDAKQFPPSYKISNENTQKLGNLFETLCQMEKSDIVIIGYSYTKHLNLFDFGNIELEKHGFKMNYKEKFLKNSIVLLNSKNRILLVSMIVEDISDMREALKICDETLRGIYLINKHLIEGQLISLIGIIALPNVKRSDLTNDQYPFVNIDNFQGYEGYIFLTKDELTPAHIKTWWNKLLSHIRKHRKNREGLVQPNIEQEIKPIFKNIAGEMMATIALIDDTLPKFTKNVTDQVSTLLLNTEQMNMVWNKKPWRVVKGPFGSGKSLILKAIARDLYHSCDSPANQTNIYYICFDPYSLLEIQVARDFKKMETKAGVKIQSANIKEIAASVGLRVEELVNLTDITPSQNIAELFDKLNSDGIISHFLIDEFPENIVDCNYCERLAKTLRDKMKECTVVFGLQSIQRTSEVLKNGKVHKIEKESLAKAGMEVLPPLKKSMRMCSNLYELVKIAQSCVTESEVPLGLPISKHAKEPFKSTPLKGTTNQRLNGNETSDSKLNPNSTKTDELAKAETQPMDLYDLDTHETDVSKMHDPQVLPKVFSMPPRENSKVLKSKFKFEIGDSGHNIESHIKPNLVYLDQKFVTDSHRSGKILSKVLTVLCIDENYQCTIICNNIHEALITKYALTGYPLIEYLPYLQERFPTKEEKEKVCDEMSNGYSILLTDYRGFRGCESDHCIIFAEEDTPYANHVIVEVLARSISKIDVLVLPTTSFEENVRISSTASMSRVFESWKKHPDLIQVKTVSTEDNGNDKSTVHFQPSGNKVEVHYNDFEDQVFFESIEKEIKSKKSTAEEAFKNLKSSADQAISGSSLIQKEMNDEKKNDKTNEVDEEDSKRSMSSDEKLVETSNNTSVKKRRSDEFLTPENAKRFSASVPQNTYSYKFWNDDDETFYDVTSSLPDDICLFSSHEKIDFFNHVTSIEESLKILAYGMKPQILSDSSRIHSNHPLKGKLFTRISPSTSSPLYASNIGNVSFSVEVTDCFEYQFYFVECVEGFDETIVRVLLTNIRYKDLLAIDLRHKNSAIFMNENNELMFGREYDLKEITIEILSEIYPFQFTLISYVRGFTARPRVTKGQVSGRYPVFTSESLGYLLFTLVKESAGSKHTVFKDENLLQELLNLCIFDDVKGIDSHYLLTDSIPSITERANQIVKDLIIPRSFMYGTNTDVEDFRTIRKLASHFEHTGHLPSPKACLRKLHDVLCVQDPEHYERSNDAEKALQVFLNHFPSPKRQSVEMFFKFLKDTWCL